MKSRDQDYRVPQCRHAVQVMGYIEWHEDPPIRVMFDLGGHEIEIDDGPVNGVIDEIRAELGE